MEIHFRVDRNFMRHWNCRFQIADFRLV
jgi:hypothetical protein